MTPEQLPDGQEFLRFTSSWDGCEQRTLMLPNPQGDWVHFWDVEKIIKQRDEARAEVERLREAAIQIRMGLIGMLLSDGLDAIDQKRRELFEITKGMVE